MPFWVNSPNSPSSLEILTSSLLVEQRQNLRIIVSHLSRSNILPLQFPDLGSYVSFYERLNFVQMPFEDKDLQAVWSGAMKNKVPAALTNAAQGYVWAGIQAMNSETRMHMVDF